LNSGLPHWQVDSLLSKCSILLHRCDYRLPVLSWYMEIPGQRSDIAMGSFNK